MKKVKLFAIAALVLSSIGGSAQNQPQAQPTDNVWSLQECIDYALAHNLTIGQSRLLVETNQAAFTQSVAGLLPTASVSTGFSWNAGRSINPVENVFTDASFQNHNISAQASLNLFGGLQQQNLIRQNKTLLEASKGNLKQSRNDAALNVALAYLQVLNTYELIQVAIGQVELSKQQAGRAERLAQAGSIPQVDFLTLQGQLANDEALLVTAQNNHEIAKLTLMQQMNLPVQANFQVETIAIANPDVQPYELDVNEIYNTALKTQPGIEGAELQIRGAQLGVAVARGAYYPSVSLDANAFTRYSSANRYFETSSSQRQTLAEPEEIGFFSDANGVRRPVFTDIGFTEIRTPAENPYSRQIKNNISQSLSVNMFIPILNGWQARNRVSRAVIQQKQAELDAQTLKVTLRQNIEQAYNNMVIASRRFVAFQTQVNALTTALRAAEIRLTAGASNQVDFTLAKQNLSVAQSNMVQSKYDYVFRTKVLDFYQNKPLTF